MFLRKFIPVIICLLFVRNTFAQDSTRLLQNVKIQVESTQAINALYNFKFKVAEKQFEWMRQEHPEHPLPHFLMALSAWWKILPYEEIHDYDDDFFKYIDLTIEKAKAQYKADKDNEEAKFFLAAAYGLKARLFSDRDNYGKAVFATKKSLSFLEKGKDSEALAPEFLLGSALYNYFREWIPKEKPFLKPVLMLFSKGDKDLGIKQLQEVSKESFYTRIEAMSFLVMVYEYEKKASLGLPVIKYLHETYPDNAYFQRKYAKLNFMYGPGSVTRRLSYDILRKYKAKMPGYEDVSARYANYYIAQSMVKVQPEPSRINDGAIEDNKIIEKKNKGLEKNKKSNKKYNMYANLVNSSRKKTNEATKDWNFTQRMSEPSRQMAKYNNWVDKQNVKIVKINKDIESYNETVKGDNAKLKLYHKILRRQGGATGKVEFSDSTKHYLKETVRFGEKLGFENKNYHINSLYFLARIAEQEGKPKKALAYYEKIKKHAEKKHELRRAAMRFIKKNKKSLKD